MGRSEESNEGTGVAVEEGRPKLKEPQRYAVLLHNDDYTTFDFVVEVLQKFFKKTAEEAAEITLHVHHEGKGLAGVYTQQIAETKVVQVMDYARAHGFPLRASAEPA
jgi:ATP-dependent Clp protease adaptor protein ClpS